MLRTHTCGQLTKENLGTQVQLSGWVAAVRNYGKICFIDVRDRTGVTQLFLNKDLTSKYGTIHKESVIAVKGKVNARPENQVNKDMPTGEVEVEVQELVVLSEAEAPLPIEIDEKSTTGLDKRLDYRFLDLRRQHIAAIFKVRGKIYRHTIDFFDDEGFVAIQTPKLTATGVESGAEEFKLPYFGKQASLAQSPQIYKQMFVVSGLEKVYEIGTVFRADKSHTTRHLTEFTGIDFEMGFIEGENDVMDVIEKFMITLLTQVKKSCKAQLDFLNVAIDVPAKIPRLSLVEARNILAKQGKIIPEDKDLDAEGEKMIGAYVKNKFKSDLVFMLDYPWDVRPFYHMRADKTGVPKSYDLLYKGLEIASGAQREHRLAILEAQCAEKGIDLKKMPFYRDIFRYGCPPHGGVGLGLDRITSQLLNLENVREAILLPRDPERLTP